MPLTTDRPTDSPLSTNPPEGQPQLALTAKRPPPRLPVRELQSAAGVIWEMRRKMGLYLLSAEERKERLGYHPADMGAYNEEVSVSVERNPGIVPQAPYGAEDLRALQAEIDEIGRFRLAVEDLLQATVDTMLDRQARRYLLCSYLVEEMRSQLERPFASGDKEPQLRQALSRIVEIERRRSDKAQASLKKGEALRLEGGEALSQLEAQLETARSENAALRQKLEALSLQPPPETRSRPR